MLVCIAGDCHGRIDQLYRLVATLEKQAGVGPVDLVVQVGDFGVWPDAARVDKATLSHDILGCYRKRFGTKAVPGSPTLTQAHVGKKLKIESRKAAFA